MPFISKNPNKAKYLVRSTKLDGHTMIELMDTKTEVEGFLDKCFAENRTNVALFSRMTDPKTRKATKKVKTLK
jgi:hypothetical protein